MSIEPKTQTTGARVTLVASAPDPMYSYVMPLSPTIVDLADWLDVYVRTDILRPAHVRVDIVSAVYATANRLNAEGKLGRGGSMNMVNNQKCRCVNARAGVYLIEELRRRNIPVAIDSVSPGVSYWTEVSCGTYSAKDYAGSAISSAGVWDSHTVVALTMHQRGVHGASSALEYDFWARGAPLVYPSGRAMSSVSRGRASDAWYARVEVDASGSFDENDCSSFW